MNILSERIILGIDPGTNIMGYGIIRALGSKIECLDFGVHKLKNTDEHSLKLKNIFEFTLQLIDKFHPDELSAEAPFFGKNVQSMLKLGRAQGVALAAALYRDIPVFEYSPRKIKQSITGSGSASKEQVAAMLKNMNLIKQIPDDLDATDGLAAALCHYYQGNKSSGINKKSYSGWKAFLNDNPSRRKA